MAACIMLDKMYHSVKNPNGEGATGGVIVQTAHNGAAWAFSTPRMAKGGFIHEEIWASLDG
jgi:beta-aspartyl-peptidase (threonine type)